MVARPLPAIAVSILAFACAEEGTDDGTGGQDSTTSTTGTPTSAGPGPSTSTTGGASSSSGGTPFGCYDYGSFTPSPASFSTDVMPLFQARCKQCHDDPAASTYYGADAAVVYDKLLHGVPKQAPHLKFVAPNDPLHSYTLAKVEYPNPGGTCSEVQCSEPGCELSAPPGNPLPEAERAMLRSWIMNGAQND